MRDQYNFAYLYGLIRFAALFEVIPFLLFILPTQPRALLQILHLFGPIVAFISTVHQYRDLFILNIVLAAVTLTLDLFILVSEITWVVNCYEASHNACFDQVFVRVYGLSFALYYVVLDSVLLACFVQTYQRLGEVFYQTTERPSIARARQ